MAAQLLHRLQHRRRYLKRHDAWALVPRRADGLPAYPVICPYCWGSDEDCRTCRGTGLVCPTCAGARWVRREGLGGDYRPARPCPTCTDWDTRAQKRDEHGRPVYRYDEQREMQAIERWIDDHPECVQLLAILLT